MAQVVQKEAVRLEGRLSRRGVRSVVPKSFDQKYVSLCIKVYLRLVHTKVSAFLRMVRPLVPGPHVRCKRL
jgi:hypothetical protein